MNNKVIFDKLMLDANIPLQEWVSNDETFNLLYRLEIPETQNVLGLSWEPHTDMLHITTRDKITNVASCKLTKRKVLSLISRVFDPLGLLSPLSIKGKIFIQTLWKEKMNWDQSLSQEQVKVVEEILKRTTTGRRVFFSSASSFYIRKFHAFVL